MTRLPFLMRLSERIGRLITHDQKRWDRNALRFERVNNYPREVDFKAKVPIGPAFKLSDNAYWQRDVRRAIIPDYTVNAQNLLSAEGQAVANTAMPPRPGNTLKKFDRTPEYYPDHDRKIHDRLENYGVTWP